MRHIINSNDYPLQPNIMRYAFHSNYQNHGVSMQTTEHIIVAKRRILDWISAAIAGSSFALLTFYASLTKELAFKDVCALGLLAISLPLAICSILTSKDLDIYTKTTSKIADQNHAILFATAGFFFVIGFLIFLKNVSHIVMLLFLLSSIVSILIYSSTYKHIQE